MDVLKIKEIWKKKWLVLFFAFLCSGVLALYGYKKANGSTVTFSKDEQVIIDNYYARIEEYDASINDVKNSINEVTDMLESLQEYCDNSIYMKLDSNEVNVASVQYAITYAEGVNAGNVNQALLAYIKDGGLKQSIKAPDELEVKYWGEVMTQSVSGNVLSITFMHYDSKKILEIMSSIKESLLNGINGIITEQGEFSLAEIESSIFKKSEISVINTQNSNRNNLRSYLSTKADYETKLVNLNIAKEKYKAENKPVVLDYQPVSKKKEVIKYAIIGFLLGIIAVIVISIFIYTFNPNIESVNDIESLKMVVLGNSKGNIIKPEAERISMDINLVLDAVGKKEAFICVLKDNALKAAEIIKDAVNCVGVLGNYYDNADAMRTLVNAGACVLVIEKGKTSAVEVKKFISLCDKYKVTIIGSILVE